MDAIRGVCDRGRSAPGEAAAWTDEENGAPGEIRTPDHLVRSQVLYPTELRALEIKIVSVSELNFNTPELIRDNVIAICKTTLIDG